MNNKQKLDEFGIFLMEYVRDRSIIDWTMILSGKSKGDTAKRISRLISTFHEYQIEMLVKLVPEIVDTTIHHFLWSIEENQDFDFVFTENNATVSLREISDGLPGELYSDDGWIYKFSKEGK